MVFLGERGERSNVIDLSSDLTLVVEIIDSEEYINKFLPYLDTMVQEGLVTIDDVEVVKYGKKAPTR